MNKVIFSFLVFWCSLLKADTIPYTQETVDSYLHGSKMVALVHKVDGYMSFDEYYRIMSQVSNESERLIYKKWKASKMDVDDKFLVLKNYSSIGDYGQFVRAKVVGAASNATEIGQTYVIFFRDRDLKNGGDLNYSICDVVSLEQEKKLSVGKLDKTALIEKVISDRLLGCYIVD